MGFDDAPDALHETRLILRREGIALRELLGHPEHADLLREAALELLAGPQGELDAPPSDVDDEGALPLEVDAVEGGEVDEPRLFLARDGLRPDPGLAANPLEEVLPVRGLADRRCRDGDDLLDAVVLGEPLVSAKGLEPS